jgi:hypothetical protein
MKMRRDDIVQQLREMGHDEAADRAERELPKRFDAEKHEAHLRSLGIAPAPFDADRRRAVLGGGGDTGPTGGGG